MNHVKGLLVNYYAKRTAETPHSLVIQAVAADPWFLGPLDGDGKSVPGFTNVPQPPALLPLKGEPRPSIDSKGRTLYEVVLPWTFKSLWFREEDDSNQYETLLKLGGKPYAKSWKPFSLRLQKGKTRIAHMWPSLSAMVGLECLQSLSKANALALLEAAGETLPVTVEGEDWKIYRCTNVADEAMLKTSVPLIKFYSDPPESGSCVLSIFRRMLACLSSSGKTRRHFGF